jgi:hypothetical protein
MMSHDEYTKLFLYMEKRFDKLEAEMATKADKADVERLYGLLDSNAKRLETIETEHVMLTHQVDHHEHWHHQVADKVNVKLRYE